MSTQKFYRAFEDMHRGERALIKQRLSQYRAFVEPFTQLDDNGIPKALDLGCGRGEWLEVLGEWGFEALGVDLDEGMLTACHERGLKALKGDAVEYLRGQEDSSLQIISGFHFAEHVSFDLLLDTFQQAHRVLCAGGLLIMETPNPENIVVGTADFYLDPTHQKPLPPLLLEFIARFSEFERIKVLRLQEREKLSDMENLSLLDVLSGVSPDYSVVAQKAGPVSLMREFDTAFDKKFGLSLEDVTRRFEEQQAKELDSRFNLLQKQLEAFDELSKAREEKAAAEVTAKQLTRENDSLKSELTASISKVASFLQEIEGLQAEVSRLRLSEARLNESVAQLETQKRTVEDDLVLSLARGERLMSELHEIQVSSDASLRELRNQIAAIFASKSWKVTRPLRAALDLILRVPGPSNKERGQQANE